MKQILLMIALVALVGCGEKEPVQTSASDLPPPPAFEETKAKAKPGDAAAQTHLGSMYANGNGVEEDDKESVKWFRKGADQGDANAQIELRWMYEEGNGGVPKDYVTAYAWHNIAAANGNEYAKKLKITLAFAVSLTAEDIAKAGELAKEMIKKNPKLMN